jgi:hypothetical protein
VTWNNSANTIAIVHGTKSASGERRDCRGLDRDIGARRVVLAVRTIERLSCARFPATARPAGGLAVDDRREASKASAGDDSCIFDSFRRGPGPRLGQ